MRIRSIKPEFWTDSLIVSLPRDIRLLFIGLWNVADDHGWIPDDPDQIRMLLFPGDPDCDVGTWIEVLVASGRLERFQTETGRRLLKVAHWTDHQKVDHPSASRIAREPSRKLAIPQAARRALAIKYGCPPGGEVAASCYFCGAPGKVYWFKLASGRPSSWVIFPDLEIDHFVPEASGGAGVADNLVLSCRGCNRSRCDKSAFDFLCSLEGVQIFIPRDDSRALAPDQGSGIRDQGVDQGTGTREQGGAKRRSNNGNVDDSEFLAGLKSETAYAGIDIDRELGKCRQWCLANNCTATRRRFVNWLNRARPVSGGSNGQPANKRDLISGSELWDEQVAAALARTESRVEAEGFGVGRVAPPQDASTGPVG